MLSTTTMINDDEFVENGTNVREEDDEEDKLPKVVSSPSHDKWIWIHAAFHCLVTMVVSRIGWLTAQTC